jgi:hypothetical protein
MSEREDEARTALNYRGGAHVPVFWRADMSTRRWWETTKVQGGELLDKVAQLVREGNVRRIVIAQGARTVAEFPLTVGVVGAVFAPVLAAVGALAALLTDCTISVEREETATTKTDDDVASTVSVVEDVSIPE